MELTMSIQDKKQNIYMSGPCSEEIFEKYAGMSDTVEDDALIVQGIWRLGIQPEAKDGEPVSRWIMVMSVFRDITEELTTLFPEIPGPWTPFNN